MFISLLILSSQAVSGQNRWWIFHLHSLGDSWNFTTFAFFALILFIHCYFGSPYIKNAILTLIINPYGCLIIMGHYGWGSLPCFCNSTLISPYSALQPRNVAFIDSLQKNIVMHKVGKVEVLAVADNWTQKGGAKSPNRFWNTRWVKSYIKTILRLLVFSKNLKYLQKQIHLWCKKNQNDVIHLILNKLKEVPWRL